MTRNQYQPLRKRLVIGGRRGQIREFLLPLLVGLSVGYALGLAFTFDEVDSTEHLARIDHDAAESTIFFLRCIIFVHPDSEKPMSFISAIRDTYGSACNQTIYYANKKEIQSKASDQSVIVVDSSLNGFYWSYFQNAINKSSTVPAQWTYVGDEQVFLSVQNLRKLVRGYNHRRALLFGRIYKQTSLFSYVFPFFQRERMSLQSGVLMTTSAIKNFSLCGGFLYPRATESALLACAKASGIEALDAVDEDGMHLFHDKDFKSLITEAYRDEHKHGNEFKIGCCSDHAVSFGQMSHREIRLGDFASTRWKVFGLGGIEEVNASYAIDPKEFEPKPKTNITTAKTVQKKGAKSKPPKPKKQ